MYVIHIIGPEATSPVCIESKFTHAFNTAKKLAVEHPLIKIILTKENGLILYTSHDLNDKEYKQQ